MAKDKQSTSSVRDVLIDIAEVQLAGLTAGVAFWTEWTKHAQKFAKTASSTLADIRENPESGKAQLSGLSEASSGFLRSMMELPLVATDKFRDELGKMKKPKKGAKKKATSKKRRRAARAKD